MYIDPGCNIELAARRLLWGKTGNAGQVCIAPDYVLVPREFQDKLVEALTTECVASLVTICRGCQTENVFCLSRYNKFYPEEIGRAHV